MTDLLGLLAGIHGAVIRHGELRIAVTDLGGLDGAVDRYTGTIHLAPGLTLPDALRVLADALAVLAPTAEELPAAIAVGGEEPGAVVPSPRHLTLVPDSVEYSEKPGRTALTSDML